MLNLTKLQTILNEIISLATPAKSTHNGILSQKLTAVMPNGLNWLFFTPKHRPTWHWCRREPTIFKPPYRPKRIGAFSPYGVVDITK
ncbi:MAG: hypothetical protein Q4B88_03285 [Moraxella sp.]|nr:hypothetical protein [Moraxella sp.]